MSTVLTLPLRDGSLCPEPMISMRSCLVARMARELIYAGTFADELDARRTLRHQGFSAFDIEVLIDDARQVAVQHVVEMEIAGT